MKDSLGAKLMTSTPINKTISITTALLASLLLTACTGTRPVDIGVTNNSLTPCPESPNCVGSFEDNKDETHYINAYSINNYNQVATWDLLQSIIRKNDSAEIISADDSYIYAEFTSGIMQFVDDTEFMLDAENKLIHLRSASRLGYRDFDVNRERLEVIRMELEKSSVVK
jgi:uncharacterized protein (DUF1499 family)